MCPSIAVVYVPGKKLRKKGGIVRLYSSFSWGFAAFIYIVFSIIIQNMPIGNTLNGYGFQHLTLEDEELKRQLGVLREHLSGGDLEGGIARSATMLMKEFLLQNILEEGAYQNHDTDETKFLIAPR